MNIDWDHRCIYIDFNFDYIDDRHSEWRRFIENGVGTGDIIPNPYWTFEEIDTKLRTKLNNLMYVRADAKVENGIEYFRYNEIEAYIDPSIDRFLDLVAQGVIYVDFDARTGHNHGTKFRIRPNYKTDLYEQHIIV